ncbi:hypothetical protein EBZ39_19265, partial [bacterium]|nr:hypothetical protein [bacterium]
TLNTLSGANYANIGVSKAVGAGGVAINSDFDNTAETAGYNVTGAKVSATYGNGTYGASFTAGDVIGVGLDVDAGTLVFYKNGTSQGTAFSNLTANAAWTPAMSMYGNVAISVNFGQRPFAYQNAGTNRPASTYKALCTANLPAPSVTKPSTVMDVKLYTGTGSAQSITGLGFNPDFVWIKRRTVASNHCLFDVVRGATKRLVTDGTDAEATVAQALTSFNSDGFTVGTDSDVNGSTYPIVSWAWDAGTSTVTNTQGSITSSVRANATAGFSVVSFTPASSGAFTIGHGLGVTPSLVIAKSRNRSVSWFVYHSALSSPLGKFLELNSTAAVDANYANFWGTSSFSSTVFGMNTGVSCLSTDNMIAYCFAPV